MSVPQIDLSQITNLINQLLPTVIQLAITMTILQLVMKLIDSITGVFK